MAEPNLQSILVEEREKTRILKIDEDGDGRQYFRAFMSPSVGLFNAPINGASIASLPAAIFSPKSIDALELFKEGDFVEVVIEHDALWNYFNPVEPYNVPHGFTRVHTVKTIIEDPHLNFATFLLEGAV